MPTDEGYPTDEDLEGLHTFKGTWREYMAYVKSIGNYWPDDHFWDEWAEPDPVLHKTEEHVYSISTGGWSGNESIISELMEEPLWFMWWWSSRRGGHYEIRIPLHFMHEQVWHIEKPEPTLAELGGSDAAT